jgi:hypothetical protein
MAPAIERVFTRNLSFSAIFGIEYKIPMQARDKEIANVKILNVARDSAKPRPLVPTIKNHAWNLDTRPFGIGLSFPFALSRLASTKSLKTYMPTIMKKEPSGKVTILNTVSTKPVDEYTLPRKVPGMQNKPANVAIA